MKTETILSVLNDCFEQLQKDSVETYEADFSWFKSFFEKDFPCRQNAFTKEQQQFIYLIHFMILCFHESKQQKPLQKKKKRVKESYDLESVFNLPLCQASQVFIHQVVPIDWPQDDGTFEYLLDLKTQAALEAKRCFEDLDWEALIELLFNFTTSQPQKKQKKKTTAFYIPTEFLNDFEQRKLELLETGGNLKQLVEMFPWSQFKISLMSFLKLIYPEFFTKKEVVQFHLSDAPASFLFAALNRDGFFDEYYQRDPLPGILQSIDASVPKQKRSLMQPNETRTKLKWEETPQKMWPGFTPGKDTSFNFNDTLQTPTQPKTSTSNVEPENQENEPVSVPEKKRRGKTPWTEYEVQLLERGLQRYGPGSWSQILKAYGKGEEEGFMLCRTQVDLKDKARNEKRRRERLGLALGVFSRV